MKESLRVIVALLLVIPSGLADDAHITGVFVKRQLNTALEILKDEDLDAEAKKEQVKELALEMFDVPYMTRNVFGRKHWPGFSNAQREEFTDLFVRQLETSYFEKMDIFSEARFEYGEPIPIPKTNPEQKKKYHVPSHVNYRDQRYEILYKLYLVENAWRVYDVEVGGISVVRTYKNQYGEFLQDASPEELLAKMRERNMKLPAELEKMEKESQETHGTNVVAAKSVEKEKKN